MFFHYYYHLKQECFAGHLQQCQELLYAPPKYAVKVFYDISSRELTVITPQGDSSYLLVARCSSNQISSITPIGSGRNPACLHFIIVLCETSLNAPWINFIASRMLINLANFVALCS